MGQVPFSVRQGLIANPAIRFRDNLPVPLREPIFQICRRYVPAAFLWERVQAILNPYGIGDTPRGAVTVAKEEDNPNTIAAKQAVLHCEWFRVYDIVEDLYGELVSYEREHAQEDEEPRAYPFRNEINEYLSYAGIGWQLSSEGQIVTRGDDAFEHTVHTAEDELSGTGRTTAAGRIKKAVQNLSARPHPDTSGAISHATGAMECVLHDITGQELTLGDYLNRHRDLFPGSIQKALHGLWGFSSQEGARHGREGAEPSREDAEFIVGIAAAVSAYLTRKHPRP
jgi:AbiJ N-terminal domain 4